MKETYKKLFREITAGEFVELAENGKTFCAAMLRHLQTTTAVRI
jgi:hypothetical protein